MSIYNQLVFLSVPSIDHLSPAVSVESVSRWSANSLHFSVDPVLYEIILPPHPVRYAVQNAE